MFGLSHRQGVLVSIFFIVIFFGFLAKLDFVLGPREYMEGVEYHLPFITVGAHWFWMWIVGYPLIAFVFTGLFLAGADDTDYNMRYGLGIFLTVILFGVGQLEDFLWHVVNWLPFPSGDWAVWGWSAENNICWMLFGTWNTPMHFVWLGSFLVVVAVMWYYLLEIA